MGRIRSSCNRNRMVHISRTDNAENQYFRLNPPGPVLRNHDRVADLIVAHRSIGDQRKIDFVIDR